MRLRLALAVFLIFCQSMVYGQSTMAGVTLSADEIMQKVDEQLLYLKGLTKLQLTITSNKGAVRVYKATLFKKQEDSLFIFDTLGRGRILRLLYNDQGKTIYAYSMLDKRLYEKRAGDRFDAVLNSGFYFFDLSNSPFSENFVPKISGREKKDGNDWLRIENIPLDRGKYSRLNVLVDNKDNFKVKRIDYYDSAGVLMKSMLVKHDKIPVKQARKQTVSKAYATKLEMMDMSKGTISILEFLLNDKTAKLDSSLFRRENIEK